MQNYLQQKGDKNISSEKTKKKLELTKKKLELTKKKLELTNKKLRW